MKEKRWRAWDQLPSPYAVRASLEAVARVSGFDSLESARETVLADRARRLGRSIQEVIRADLERSLTVELEMARKYR